MSRVAVRNVWHQYGDRVILEHLTFNFPELNLVLLALILAMGQYTGYKLSELRRFRAMDEVS